MTIVATVNFAAAPKDEPITKGLYRYSRHPMYVALFLIYLSVGIASASWIFLLASFMWLILTRFAAIDEERYCSEKYGLAYREYINRTPRWIGIPR